MMTQDPPTNMVPTTESLRQTLVENLALLRAFALSRLGDSELAADVVQDTLLKALRAETRLEEGDNLVAWLYRILRNSITDLHRKRATQLRALENFGHQLDAGPDEEARQTVCRCLKQLLPTLRPEYADVVRRIDFEEQSQAEVASDLGISQGNLKVRLHRARQQLKDRLVATCQLCATHGCLDCDCPPNNQPRN
jgi:RNA polymerase sigma factor (sigma-70 family)